jgi:hypothetical protein
MGIMGRISIPFSGRAGNRQSTRYRGAVMKRRYRRNARPNENEIPTVKIRRPNPGRKAKRGRRASGSPGSAAARLAWWRWHQNPLGGVRGRRGRNPGSQDNMNADELALFIINDGDLYRQNISMVIKNLAKKIKKGAYDPQKALKLWQYSAQWGAQKYTKENGIRGTNGSYGMFSPHDRREAAKQLADYYEDELREAAGTKSNPRHRRTTMARRRKHSRNTLPQTVTFRKGGRHTVVFRHRKATASTRAMRRAAGRRLAKMWTRAERLANLKKARAALRRKRR